MAKDDFVKNFEKKDFQPQAPSDSAQKVPLDADDLLISFQQMVADMFGGGSLDSEMREKMKAEMERLITEVGDCRFGTHPFNLQVIGEFPNGISWDCIWGNSTYGSKEGHIEIQIGDYGSLEPPFPIGFDGIGHAPVDQMIEFLKAVKKL